MTVRGWIDLAQTSRFQNIDVLWRDADIVIVAAQKAAAAGLVRDGGAEGHATGDSEVR